jgi:hypothetical protein
MQLNRRVVLQKDLRAIRVDLTIVPQLLTILLVFHGGVFSIHGGGFSIQRISILQVIACKSAAGIF